jgi:hypothetical protein
MAKTTFVDGTSTIWASFMNSIFNTDGGHKHDGGTDDGSAGKIDPATEVDWGTDGVATVTEPFASKTLFTLARTAGEFWLQCTGLLSSWVSTDQIYPLSGSEVDFQNPDTTWVDIEAGAVKANGDVEGDAGTFTGLVTTTGQVNGDIKVTGPGTFYSIVTFHWNGTAIVTDEEYGGRVASIARGVAGSYTVTFTDALPLGTTHPMWAASSYSGKDGEMVATARATAATTVKVQAKNSAAGSLDPGLVHLFIPQMS